jgi:uncharacterized protein
MRLADKRVLITGASRGIGAALAGAFAARGARVVLSARDSDRLREAAERLGGHAFPADLDDASAVRGLIGRVEVEHGPLDILVNNAGIESTQALWAMTPEAVERVVRLNLTVPMELTRQALQSMRSRNQGRIVNISSLAGVVALPGFATYGAAKAGLTHFTACLRADLRGTGIGTTVVEVGPVATDLLEQVRAYPTIQQSYDRLGRLGLLPTVSANRVAEVVVSAVERNRGHVRLPRRAAAASLLPDLPRLVVGALTAGIAHEP